MPSNNGLVATLIKLPIFQAEWVLWLLIMLSLVSVAIMIERLIFFKKHHVDVYAIKERLTHFLKANDLAGAAKYVQQFNSLETNILYLGLCAYPQGPDAVEDLLAGALRKEHQRYAKNLNFLATLGSNAPFIGLFGTVLGIIHSFQELASNMQEASSSVMAGISEALIATAVGLLVAIPALIAYNYFKSREKDIDTNASLLNSILLAHLKALDNQLEPDEALTPHISTKKAAKKAAEA